ncbi:MAG: hypothetical protein PHQ60_16405 [Sideroxydans sp.]|nr:hypothetical protein [Sideroxydans sp.]
MILDTMAQDRYDEEQMELAALYRQLEAWLESWQDLRVRPGGRLTHRHELESRRLARRVGEVLL